MDSERDSPAPAHSSLKSKEKGKEEKQNAAYPASAPMKKLRKGMAELNSFGFKTSATHADLSLLLLFRSHCPLNLGFHVSDLWSQRQQQEFLKTMKLEKAQLAREREASFINFLVATKKKPAPHALPDVRPESYRDTRAFNKYLPAAAKLSHSQGALPTIKSAPQLLDDIIGQCSSTLASFKGHKKLALTPRARISDGVLRDSARTLKLSGKRFANKLRK